MLMQRLLRWVRRLCRPTRRATRGPALQLEALEDRRTPAVMPNAVFASSLYGGLLGRAAEPAGLAGWTAALNGGASRALVAQEIATSTEAHVHDVDLFYLSLLGRRADPGGLVYWAGQLEAGATLDQVKGGILGSPEFFNRAGGTNVAFLDALYRHELNRPVDASGLTTWFPMLSAGVSRTAIADDVLGSFEAAAVKTTSFYIDTLARTPDPVWLTNFTIDLQTGMSESWVLANLLGSDEYFARVQTVAAGPQTDPNHAALQMILGGGLFAGPLPNAEQLTLQAAGPVPAYFIPAPPVVPHAPPSDGTDTGTDDTGDVWTTDPGTSYTPTDPTIDTPPPDYTDPGGGWNYTPDPPPPDSSDPGWYSYDPSPDTSDCGC